MKMTTLLALLALTLAACSCGCAASRIQLPTGVSVGVRVQLNQQGPLYILDFANACGDTSTVIVPQGIFVPCPKPFVMPWIDPNGEPSGGLDR